MRKGRYYKAIFSCGLLFSTFLFGEMENHLITFEKAPLQKSLPMEGWIEDFSEAKRLAQKQNCPILIAFLGPNWCPWSDQLEREVLVQKIFAETLKKDLIFFKVDLPEALEGEKGEEVALQHEYGVEECPSLVLVEATGELIGKIQYLPIGAKELCCMIQEMLSDYQSVTKASKDQTLKKLSGNELIDLYTKAGHLADTTFKENFLKQGLKIDRGADFLLAEYGELLAQGRCNSRKLRRIRNKISARDPYNEKGCQRKLAMIEFEVKKHSQNIDTVIHPLVSYLKKFGDKDKENAWQIEMKISQYLYSKNEIEKALVHAKASLTLAPQSIEREIVQSIEFLETKRQ